MRGLHWDLAWCKPDTIILFVYYSDIIAKYIMTWIPIARQRLAKHIQTGANARNNRMFIAM